MVVITPPDMNDSRSRVVLGGVEYIIQFRYNFTGRYWSFGLFSSDETPLLVGTKMVPCYPLNIFYDFEDIVAYIGQFGETPEHLSEIRNNRGSKMLHNAHCNKD